MTYSPGSWSALLLGGPLVWLLYARLAIRYALFGREDDGRDLW